MYLQGVIYRLIPLSILHIFMYFYIFLHKKAAFDNSNAAFLRKNDKNLEFSVPGITWKRNHITNVRHARNEQHHALEA